MLFSFNNKMFSQFIIIIVMVCCLNIGSIKCSDEGDTNYTVLITIPPTTTNSLPIDLVASENTFPNTMTSIPRPDTPLHPSSLVGSQNQQQLTGNSTNTTAITKKQQQQSVHMHRKEFVAILDGILLVTSNLFLLPAIYVAIQGQFRGEAIVYTFTMIFSALYHICDCEAFGLCILPYDMLQFGDFFSATMSLWCTAIVIANVPYHWISSFHLSGAIIYGSLLHFWNTGTWCFVIPAVCTLLLLASFWGYHYYKERTLPELLYSNNFYAAIGLMALGSLMFGSQTIPYLRRLYGISHSIWHITMSLSIALLLPRCPNVESFWKDNLNIAVNNNEQAEKKPPIISIGKPVNHQCSTNVNSSNTNDFHEFNSHVNRGFSLA